MMNWALINSAVEVAYDYLIGEQVYESHQILQQRAINWYNNTEITDVTTLAAVIISGDFQYGITFVEIQSIKNFFFPPYPILECIEMGVDIHNRGGYPFEDLY